MAESVGLSDRDSAGAERIRSLAIGAESAMVRQKP
jgi:hypothetical protein